MSLAYRRIDESGVAFEQQFARDAIGRLADSGHRDQRVRASERLDGGVEVEHRASGARVPPPALALAGHVGHVQQQAAQVEVRIRHGSYDAGFGIGRRSATI